MQKKKYIIFVQLIIINLNCSFLMLPRNFVMDTYHGFLYLDLTIHSYPNRLKLLQGLLFYPLISVLNIAVGVIFRLALDFSDLKKNDGEFILQKGFSCCLLPFALCVGSVWMLKTKCLHHLGSRSFPAWTHIWKLWRWSQVLREPLRVKSSHRAGQDVSGAHCFECVWFTLQTQSQIHISRASDLSPMKSPPMLEAQLVPRNTRAPQLFD